MLHMTLLAHTEHKATAVIPQWTLADRLRKAREMTGLDQIRFSEVVGISRTSITNYEMGKREPRGLYLRAYAEATGVPIEWILTGETPADSEKAPTANGEGLPLPRLDSNQQPAGLRQVIGSSVAIPGNVAEFLTYCAAADVFADVAS